MKKKFTDILITWVILFVGQISIRLSKQRRTSFGRLMGNLLRLLSHKRQIITLENINRAFSDKDTNWQRNVMRESYHNLGITMVELLALKSFDEQDIHDYIKFSNIELMNEVHERGKGVIMLSGHYGNWELMAYSGAIFSGIPIMIIVKPQKNKVIDQLLNEYRTQNGNSVVSMYNSALSIIKTFKKGGIIALLADQSTMKNEGFFVDFFGVPAATFKSPAEMALKFNVPIIMGFAERQEDGKYLVDLQEVEFDDLENTKEGIYDLTCRHVKVLEDAIRKNPGLWAWQHRRWKHTPERTIIE